MKSNINILPLRTWSRIPKSWDARPLTANYNTLPESELFADGWRDVVVPVLTEDQKLGSLVILNDSVTYEIIDKTPEELEAERKALVPLSISKLQAMIMLGRLGIKDGVLNLVSTSDNLEVQSYFEYAATWERASPIINSLAPALGMSQLDLDNFFSEAEKIN
jgi:hypothetical protein